jgi:hypothetical protein
MFIWRSIFGSCLAAVFLCALPLSAQQIPGKFQLVIKGGEDISITLQGRNLILRPGDAIPIGATIRTTEGTNVVLSPAPGVLMVIEQNSQVKLMRNALSLSGDNPTSQIELELFNGRLSVDTANALSLGSRIVITVPQGQFISNNAAYTVTARFPDLGQLERVASGLGVVSGQVTAILNNGEQLGIREGNYLAISGTGAGLLRYVKPGELPAFLATFEQGEIAATEGDTSSIGGGRTSPDAEDILSSATNTEVEQELLALLREEAAQDLANDKERSLNEGETLGMDGSEAPPGVIEGMNNAVSASAAQGLAAASASSLAEVGVSAGTTAASAVGSSGGSQTGGGTTGETIASFLESISVGNSEAPITVLSVPIITSSSSVSGIRDTAFSYAITTDVSPANITASDMPPGLSLNGSTIEGIPTTNGIYNVTLTTSNESGSNTFFLVITIRSIESPILTISPTVPASLAFGNSYTFTLTATSPNGSALTGITRTGTLPDSLTFDGANTISGTVTILTGNFTSLFSVSNADGSATTTLTFSVSLAPNTGDYIPGADRQDYVTPDYAIPINNKRTSAALNTVSSPIPGVYWGTAGDGEVVASGGGLYWPWADNTGAADSTLGLPLLQAGVRPVGDLFAAFYVYTNFSIAADGVTVLANTTGPNRVETPGTFPIPPLTWGNW